jgi:rubrerythrin
MVDELAEVWDMAIYKEIASQSLYLAARHDTEDPAAKVMLAELAANELKHAAMLRKIKKSGWGKTDSNQRALTDLRSNDYLNGPDILEGAGLQEVLIFAIKREQQSLTFYAQMMGALSQETSKSLCLRLAREELHHKMRLELEYEELFPDREY